MLKPDEEFEEFVKTHPAAFGRLCVETVMIMTALFAYVFQPPSGGCVLKRQRLLFPVSGRLPAAFGRLCVETVRTQLPKGNEVPAAFGRLCVETLPKHYWRTTYAPAAFGRLCVETATYARRY